MSKATRGEICAIACADAFRGNGEILASCFGTAPAIGALVFTPLIRGRAADFPDPRAALEAPRTLSQEFRRAFAHRSYLYLCAAFFVCGFHVTFIGTHLPAYVGDIGQSTSTGSTALALIGLFNVFGSLTAGVLGSRFSNTKLLAGIYGLRALVISAFMLLPAGSGLTLGFAVAMGSLWLATVPLTGAIVARQFGTTHSGALFGVVFLGHQMGSFIGAWAGGEVADATGSYASMWWIAALLGVGATVLHLLIDEGPAPEEPIARRGPRLAPAALALVIVFGAASAAVTQDDAAPAPLWCHLAPHTV